MRTHPNNTKDDEISKITKNTKINKEQQNDNEQITMVLKRNMISFFSSNRGHQDVEV
jgi:hypothetical protein